MKEQNEIDDKALREAMKQHYSPIAEQDSEQFREQVMQHLPERERLLSRLWRGWLWYMKSPAWMMTALVICLIVSRKQIVLLTAKLVYAPQLLENTQTLYAGLIVLTSVIMMVRKMIQDVEEMDL